MSQYHGSTFCDITFNAEADLRLYRYHVVKLGTAANSVGLSTAATDAGVIGVLQNEPNLNEQAIVRIFGPSKCYVDEAITKGDWLAADGTSHAIQNVADRNVVVGRALETNTSTTPVIQEIFVCPMQTSHA